jgi:hypothetical protein
MGDQPADRAPVPFVPPGDGPVDDATLAHVLRFAQWALDEAAHNLLSGRVPPRRLDELARGLEGVAGLLRARPGVVDVDRDDPSG